MPDSPSRVAVVTGAGRGVGAAIALALADSGWTVVGVARSGDQLSDVATQAEGMSGSFLARTVDVTSWDEVDSLGTTIEGTYGSPSVLVNGAGSFGPIQLIAQSDPTAWLDTLAVGVGAPYLTTRRFLPAMLERGWGRIINLSSAASLHPPGPLNSAYGTAKVALNQFTRHLASEIAGTGVTANVVHPGDIKTAMWADIRNQAVALGEIADPYLQWTKWVEETGGDPPEKAAQLVLDLIQEDPPRNGEFCWIEDPLQAPIDSWPPPSDSRPWMTD
jgi:NAD(P)-dependent dehydrogenase (short-subunit alcohol dehydrogenase family)